MTWPNSVQLIAWIVAIVLTSCRSHVTTQNIEDTILISRIASLNIWQAQRLEVFDTITYTALPGSFAGHTDTPRAVRAVRHTMLLHGAHTQAVDTTVNSAEHHQQRTDIRESFTSRTSTRQFLFVFSLYTLLLVLVICCLRKFL